MQIAITEYRTSNIGDDIQRLALERLLPQVDLRIDRDDMRQAERLSSDTRMIVCGWHARTAHRRWPIRTDAEVLYIGFHANDSDTIPVDAKYPIGCRDLWTYDLCRKKNVHAWLSWCVTLTLNLTKDEEGGDILFVDLPTEAESTIPEPIVRAAKHITHVIPSVFDRTAEAEKKLISYMKAKLVVTSRLHAMLPCLTLGVPVVLVPPPYHPYRFDSFRHMAWDLNDAPWDAMRPRIAPGMVRGMSIAFRETLERFVKKEN